MANKPVPKPAEAVTVGVWLPRDEYLRLKQAADQADRTISSFIRLTLRDRLDAIEKVAS